MLALNYLRYSPDLEVIQPNEEALTAEIVESMARVNVKIFDRHRHAVRDAHSKSHGILKGTLTVYPDLPAELSQGVFQPGAEYPVIVRLSTAPGDIQNDHNPSPRGFAIKMLGVPGLKLAPGQENEVTQDWLLVNYPAIPFGNVASYWKFQQGQEKSVNAAMTMGPEIEKAVGIVGELLHELKINIKLLDLIAKENYNILGETFYSMAAVRYGDYVAKVCVAPLSDNVKALTGGAVAYNGDGSELRDIVVNFFRENSADYEFRVQLNTDLAKMPIEDASVEWPETLSPYVGVAKLHLPAQEAYSPARRVFADDVLSFNPWHCIAEHQPLGNIMRIRKAAYASSSGYRHATNMVAAREPRGIGELPD